LRRRQAVADLDRMLSAMVAHQAKSARERKAASDTEQILRGRLTEFERTENSATPLRRAEVSEMLIVIFVARLR